MENASKALIIAGSILIAIILIGMGVLLINNSKKIEDDSEETMTVIDESASQTVESIKDNLGIED